MSGSKKHGFLITLCGAGGTGKTTTSEGFMQTKVGRTFETVPSAARKVCKRWGITTEDEQAELSSVEFSQFQNQVTNTWVDDVNAILAQDKRVISDRSMIDHLAYSTMKWAQRRHLGMDRGIWSEDVALDCMETIERLADRELPKADILGFFPHGAFVPPADGHRTQSEVERKAVDLIMRGLIWKYKSQFALPLAEFQVVDPVTRVKHLDHFACTLLGILKVGKE